MEFRRIFDTIPEQFDKFRPRYSQKLFDYLIDFAKLGPEKTVLEIGPGTGQATNPILETGCDYHAIELGERLYAKMREKYDRFSNFHIVLQEPYKTPFFEGLRNTVAENGGKVVFEDTYILYLAKKPLNK